MKDLTTGEENADLELATEEQEMNLALQRQLERAAEEAPIIKLVNLVLTDAVKRGASEYSHRALRKRRAGALPN